MVLDTKYFCMFCVAKSSFFVVKSIDWIYSRHAPQKLYSFLAASREMVWKKAWLETFVECFEYNCYCGWRSIEFFNQNLKANLWIWIFLGKLGQYRVCWYPDSLHHQVITSHVSDLQCKIVTDFHEEGFQILLPFLFGVIIKIQVFMFLQKVSIL